MAIRLSKIVTRTGDDGSTGLGDGSRTSKDSLRIAALGDVDELNSLIGVILCEDLPEDVRKLLTDIQHNLLDLGSDLSRPSANRLSPGLPEQLEAAIDRYNASLGPLKEFILPGGSRSAALTHLARTVCRRVERSVVALRREAHGTVSDTSLQYLNRLSDLLFVLARSLNNIVGTNEELWQKYT